MKELQQLSWFLGIKFTFHGITVTVDQTEYVGKILNKFQMQDCKPRVTPYELRANHISKGIAEQCDQKLYQEIVGSLGYLMTATGPDLSFIVTTLSQFMANSTSNHL